MTSDLFARVLIGALAAEHAAVSAIVAALLVAVFKVTIFVPDRRRVPINPKTARVLGEILQIFAIIERDVEKSISGESQRRLSG